MRLKSFIHIAVLLMLAVSFASCGQRKVVLIQDVNLTGFTFIETNTTTMDNIELIYEHNDQIMTSTMTAVTTQKVEEQIISPGRIRVHIIEDIAQTAVNMDGDAPEAIEEKGVLHDKVLIAERIGAQWIYALEEDPDPSESQQSRLDDLASLKEQEDIIYPKEMISVGQLWEIDPEAISKMFGIEQILHSTGEGTLQFEEVTMYNGYECALLTLNMTVSAEIIDDELGRSQMNLEAEGKIYRSLELFRDIGTEIRGVINIHSEDEETGMTVTMQGPVLINSHVEITEIDPS